MRTAAMARFDVYISDHGLAEIDGDPLVPAPDQSVHEVVLDQLHRYAHERDAAVEAMVHDSPGGTAFVLRVLPDGSSNVLAPEETPAAEPAPEPEPAGAGATTGALATAIARARAAAAAGATAVTGADAAPHAVPVDLPAELTEPVLRIRALADAGLLDEALAEATALRERLTSSMGAGHPNALEARSVEAYLAHLSGAHREAIVLALAVARIRCGAGHSQAPLEVARAAAAWKQLDDDRAIVSHGHELIHMWRALEGRSLLSSHDTELAEQVRRHVDTLAAYV
ncbi:hypothetical protein ACIQM0_27010 [Streptomyces sp. NPDC091387]|uniref:hypothetical protein n=1 Tax=Streptomyces sp. NPDC091387 TaxID=3365998 RepID=UPI00381255DD